MTVLAAFDFPALNAGLNSLSGLLIVLGYAAIRRKVVRAHMICMLTALVVSAAFLTSYLYFHLVVKAGRETRLSEIWPTEAPQWLRTLYYATLISHVFLAVVVTPMALYTAYLGLKGRLQRHVWLARWTLPIWLYVSVTGVIVYWMLYRLYAAA
jgi:putative membrane protein